VWTSGSHLPEKGVLWKHICGKMKSNLLCVLPKISGFHTASHEGTLLTALKKISRFVVRHIKRCVFPEK
jgi:hypothetical protein